MRRVQALLALATVLTGFFEVAGHCGEPDSISEGELLYKQGRFSDAKHVLDEVIVKHPSDAAAHYLMGNVLVELRNNNAALEEYRTALRLDKTGAVASYCNTAIAELLKRASGANVAKSADVVNNAVVDPSVERERESVKRSVQDLSGETSNLSDAQSQELAARLKIINEDCERQISHLQQEKNDRVNELQQNYLYTKSGAKNYFPGVTQDIAKTQMDYERRMEEVRMRARQELDRANITYTNRKRSIEESATEIDRSYLNADPRSTVRLAPQGTNMFNRNYQTSGEPSGSQLPISAPPAKPLEHR